MLSLVLESLVIGRTRDSHAQLYLLKLMFTAIGAPFGLEYGRKVWSSGRA